MVNSPKDLPMFQNASHSAFEKARALRKSPTIAEDKLWQFVRGRKMLGKKFRRQHPFEEFILDFYCHECKLVVEIDGDYHLSKEQTVYDANRTAFLNEQGLSVLRFTNRQVMAEIDTVIRKVKEVIKQLEK
jgi:very-short-patch-repair endonuclease